MEGKYGEKDRATHGNLSYAGAHRHRNAGVRVTKRRPDLPLLRWNDRSPKKPRVLGPSRCVEKGAVRIFSRDKRVEAAEMQIL